MQNIYLIRHFKPETNPKVLLGHSNPDLDQNSVPERLSKLKQENPQLEKVEKVYTSTMIRARESAKIIFPELRAEEQSRLMELNFGDFELKTWSEIQKNSEIFFENYMKNWKTMRFPNGESFADLKLRLESFIEEHIINNHLFDTLAIVSHGGTTKALVNLLTSKNIEDSMAINIDYGSAIHLQRATKANSFSIVDEN